MKPNPPMTETKPRRRRWWRILKRVLLSLVALILILVFGVFPYWAAGLMTGARTRPMDRRLTETPANFGAAYKDVEFETSDGVKLSGWLLPGTGKHVTIVYSHGLFRSRRELLARAVDLWRLGYGALLYDSRNHGESGQARVGLGYFERLDAEAAVGYLRGVTTDRIALFGISMGAVAALLAAAETPEVSAVISDSAFLSFDDTVSHHVKMFLHLPAFPMANELKFFIERRGGFDSAKLDMVDAVNRIGDRPILFIAGANDKRMPPEIARRLREASKNAMSDLLVVEGAETATHGHSYQADSRLYVDRVSQFLDSALQGRDGHK
ncbi:MAG TPA: alpha/beta hydrolase [Blastocatellia bacterium]|nr:alpha/beta hydrolase [Blastocatellia bacterium]